MTEFYYKNRNYRIDHRTFGGLIYPSDYNTEFLHKHNAKGSPIASRIMADKKFDRQCGINKEIIKRNGGNK